MKQPAALNSAVGWSIPVGSNPCGDAYCAPPLLGTTLRVACHLTRLIEVSPGYRTLCQPAASPASSKIDYALNGRRSESFVMRNYPSAFRGLLEVGRNWSCQFSETPSWQAAKLVLVEWKKQGLKWAQLQSGYGSTIAGGLAPTLFPFRPNMVDPIRASRLYQAQEACTVKAYFAESATTTGLARHIHKRTAATDNPFVAVSGRTYLGEENRRVCFTKTS